MWIVRLFFNLGLSLLGIFFLFLAMGSVIMADNYLGAAFFVILAVITIGYSERYKRRRIRMNG